MRKIVNPCVCEVYGGKSYNAFARIEYKDGRLSICGVVGPMSNGDCRGSAGQCVDSIRAGVPKSPWTVEMLKQFCDIWDEWHLNDMRAYCAHMKALGWDKQATEKIVLRHYRLTSAAIKKQREAEGEAMTALRNGITFTPTAEQSRYAALPYSAEIYGDVQPDDEFLKLYEPKKKLFDGDTGPEEITTRGWVWYGTSADDTAIRKHSELGFLGRPCPVCDHKYGHGWVLEEVPEGVIRWLESLPDTEIQPAWV